jgi:disulfide bond formation protein DsbB
MLAIVFLIGAAHAPGRAGTLLYSGFAVSLAGFGAVVAGRQVWLQHLPKYRVPACGPGLEYMLKKLPLGEVLNKVFAGSGECAEAGWRFLGLTVAGWSLVWFVLLGTLVVTVVVVAFRQSAGVRK